jgi:hypothetical protein
MNRAVPVFAALFLLLTSGIASAVVIDVSPDEKTVSANSPAVFQISLENRGRADSFYVFVTGFPAHWVNLGNYYVIMESGSSMTFPLTFYPNDDAGTYRYEVFFQSASNPEIMVSDDLTLNVEGSGELQVTSYDITRDGGAVNIELTLSSAEKREVTLEFSLVSDSGKTVATSTRTLTIDGEHDVACSLQLPQDMIAGTYTASAAAKEYDIEVSSSFEIDAVSRVVKQEEEIATPFFVETRISLSNEGNVVEEGYTVTSSIPTGFVTFNMQPETCTEDGDCEWVVSRLNPEESMQIIYRLEYWPLVAEGLLVALLLGAFVVFGWNRANRPRMSKRLEKKEDGSYTAVIEIRNAGNRISNVIVRDNVSPLFKVSGRFDAVKPAVRQNEDGTELVWSLGGIEPKDHRILHYGLKPVIKGHLKIPEAYMRYSKPGGKISKVRARGTAIAV